jgi:addiction module HigA family antidote
MAKSPQQPGMALLRAGITPIAMGEFIERRVLEPRHLQPAAAANAIGIEASILKAVLYESRPVDETIASKLAQFTGTTIDFWLNLQAAIDLVRRR